MKQQLEQLKNELREFIELSKRAAPRPWKATKSHNHLQGEEPTYDVVGPHSDWFFLESEQDATFIAHSRNISPAMAECLLVAVDGIETSLVYAHFIEKTDIEALQRTLQQILTIWEASK